MPDTVLGSEGIVVNEMKSCPHIDCILDGEDCRRQVLTQYNVRKLDCDEK